MARFTIKQFSAACAIALLTACGGHSGSIPAPGGSQAQSGTRGTLRVTVPAKPSASTSKRREYVSSATQSVTLTYTEGSTTYPAQAVNVTNASPNCIADQNYDLTCTFSFNAVAGNATYTVSAYDGQNGTGNLISSATSSMKIVAGQNNQFNVTLSGVVSQFEVGFTTPNSDGTIPAATATDVPLTIGATDPDGSLILNSPQLLAPDGSVITALTLTITGDPATFSLTQNGTTLAPTSGSTYTIQAPFNGIALHYNGGPYQNASVTVGAGSASGQAKLAVEPVVTEFALPSGIKLLGEGQMAAGPDGNLWFAECQNGATGVGKITPAGTISEYPLQSNAIGCGITSANGNLWISEDGNCPNLCGIEEISPAGTILASIPVYHGTCDPYPGQMATDTSGNVWYDNSACSTIGYLPASNRTTEQHFVVPSNGVMTAASDGNIWYVADDANNTFDLGKISTSGATQTYSIPQSGTGNSPSLASRSSDGSMWVEHQNGAVDSLAPTSAAVTTTALDASAKNSIIAAGSDGNIYAFAYVGYGYAELDSIAANGTVSPAYFYGNPTFQVFPTSFVAGPAGTNTFWFVDPNSGKIARISLGG